MKNAGNRETVRDRFLHWASVQPDKPFLQCGGDCVTYGEMADASDRVAGGLQRLGVAKGQQIAFVLPNRIEFATLFLACARLGVLQVPLNPFLRGEFLRYQLADSEAATIVTDALGLEQVRPLAQRLPGLRQIVVVGELPVGSDSGIPGVDLLGYSSIDRPGPSPTYPELAPGDLCSIMYTSGTTGMPKGCMMSNGYYLTIARELITAEWIEHSDVLFTAYQLFHTSGQIYGVTTALNAGASLVLEPEFSASRYMARVRETGATVLYGAGAMALALLAQPPHPSDSDNRLRLAMWLPMTADKQLEFEGRFGTRVTAEIYGQTEALIPAISALSDERRPGTAGRVTPYFDVRLVDDDDEDVPIGEVGEITVRPRGTNGMFGGYWRKPDATAEAWRNLWHHTGDCGRLDADGYLTFVDRKKDALRRRGENVASVELERAILAHPEIGAVAVHAVPSELSEDEIKACLVPAGGAELKPAELFEFFKRNLPYYAVPRYVEIVDELPTNVMGRVQKFKLVERGITERTWDFEALGHAIERNKRRTS
ncbi:AMP-binding protein [Mycobacterium sp. AZCC_0083]|uniref:AMP-binding protein n=1 Tax=Mycobacterium sp. AZCC_0083 TaxID=2735882 RepID=UPI001615A772|nr:AMP-binding protein [Mycobacterium sp. AZCC_0083]